MASFCTELSRAQSAELGVGSEALPVAMPIAEADMRRPPLARVLRAPQRSSAPSSLAITRLIFAAAAPSPPGSLRAAIARTLSSAHGRNTRTHRRGVAGAQLQTRTTEPHACAHQATRPRLLAAREHSSACYSAMPEAAAAGVSRHAAHGPNSRLSSSIRISLLSYWRCNYRLS